MKKVLFIAYQFPPQSGPGVHRSLNFAKYLREFNYEPIVITRILSDNKMEALDKDLLNQLSSNTKIIRLKGVNFERVIKYLMHLRIYRFFWFFFYPLLWEFSTIWFLSVQNKIVQIAKEENIQLIYTSSGPFSSLILGRNLQKKLKLKWVADLRDPFTDGYAWAFPSKIHWYMMRFWEKQILSKPDKLIVNTNEVRNLYLKRKINTIENIKVITNGY